MRRALLAVLVMSASLATAACQDLPDVPGACGNGVIEAGEDCEVSTLDGSGEVIEQCGTIVGANACFYECVDSEDDQEDIGCPQGFTCGADDRCRQAGGRFDPQAELDLEVDDIEVGDIDGDRFDDLVSASGSTMQINFGTDQADLTSSLSTPVSSPAIAIAIGDLDANKIDDILVATSPGVQAFLGASERTLDPFSYPVVSFGPAGSPVRAVALDLDPDNHASEVLLAWEDRIGFAVAPGAGLAAVTTLPSVVGGLGAESLVPPLATARLTANRDDLADDDDDIEIALGYQGRSDIFLYRASYVNVANAPNPLVTTNTLTGFNLGVANALRASPLFFGHVNADGCEDLIAHVGPAVGVTDGLLVAFLNGLVGDDCSGTLATTPVALTGGAIDAADRVFAVADFNGDRITDFVSSQGIFVLGSQGQQVALADPPFEGAIILDINGDGALDVAGFREGLPDVELLINAGAAFNRFVIATTESVSQLATGDFDGDLTQDLAIVETNSDLRNIVGVSFGQFLGPPSPRVVMDRFDSMAGIVGAAVFASNNTLDSTDDLVVFSENGTQNDATVLFGSGARAMTSPLILRAATTIDSPRSLALGQLDAEGGLDLFSVGAGDNAFQFSGDGGGGFVEVADGRWLSGFDADDALWATGDVDGDDDQEVAAIDRNARRLGPAVVGPVDVLLFEPGELGTTDGRLLATVDGFTGGHALSFADLDGDLDIDLLVSFDLPLGDSESSGVLIGWNDGNGITELSEIPDAEGCFDAVPIVLDGDDAPEFVALCRIPGRSSLELRRFDATGPEIVGASDESVADTPGDRETRLRTGDFDGDGLADIAVVIKGGESAKIRILSQRDAHEN